MEKNVLLLSSWYLPLRIVPWQLAVKFVYEARVDVLAHYDEQISSPSVTWHVPAVIRYRRGAPRKKPRLRFSRGNVFLRDGYTCQYCGQPFPQTKLTLDHVTPRSEGGLKCWDNIVTACRPCNTEKSNLSCDEAGMFPLNEPVLPDRLPLVPRRFGVPQIPTQWIPYLQGWT